MDKTSQETLAVILQREPESLSRDEMEFVMARRSYLSNEDKKRFAHEIELHEEGKLFEAREEAGEESEGEEGDAPAPKKARRTRKS